MFSKSGFIWPFFALLNKLWHQAWLADKGASEEATSHSAQYKNS